MGVPKFYRWISERYPCLSEVVKEFQLPEFDNLYLDMNGIVHVCSHPEDDNPHFRITEEQIFKDICHYIEFLFRMIKPRKVFFMAIDGVAPRAKMNQQRGRRFRSARDAEELIKQAIEKGEEMPTEKRFDSNCITPGTPFMKRLQDHLKYFVVNKVTHDPLWQGPKIILSGHETPGEGEHKVMDFIRYSRSQPDHDPNTRHCLYGLDADLIMLGLASHEPRFALLREEVRFGGKKDRNKRPATPEETTFHLLHLSLMREYLDYEFSPLKSKLPFEYNLENVIDDWILMGFLVGNDFIPHLPHLHIHHDALPVLWKNYMDVLPTLDGYLNEGGHLNLARFEKYIGALAQFDRDEFSKQFVDMKFLEGKRGGKGTGGRGGSNGPRQQRNRGDGAFAALEGLDDMDMEYDAHGNENGLLEAHLAAQGIDTGELDSDEDFDTFDAEFNAHKRDYYITKMEYEAVTPEVLREQAYEYVRAIQWILLYYFEGVQSWSWFYPHHYAPYISDVRNFSNMNLQFDMGEPFRPFEQLMAVLPAASKELLPEPLQELMTSETSPVLEYYPVKFKTDLNGKQQDWEAVVLIPFIDENQLLAAIRMKEHRFTPGERQRNSHGPCYMYQYSPELLGVYPSPMPGAFPDVAANHAKVTSIPKFGFCLPPERIFKGLLEGAEVGVYYPGFPTLKHIPHDHALDKRGVKVFQMNSRGSNMILKIRDLPERTVEDIASDLLGHITWVGWPHLQEAKVYAVSDEKFRIEIEEHSRKGQSAPVVQWKRKELHRAEQERAYREASEIKEKYLMRFGVDVGKTTVLIYARLLKGRKYVYTDNGRVTTEKQFGQTLTPFALQATTRNVRAHAADDMHFQTMEELFPPDAAVFMLGNPHYGCQGEVLEVDIREGRVRVSFNVLQEPNLSSVHHLHQMEELEYMPGHVAAQRLGLSNHMVSRITGTVLILRGSGSNPESRANIGLNLKFTKRGEEVPGYTKKTEDGWLYSGKCLEVINGYLMEFSELWDYIASSQTGNSDMYTEQELFPEDSEKTLKDVLKYLESVPSSKIQPIKTGADIIGEATFLAIERAVDEVVEANKKKQKKVKMQVKPHLLFRPLPNQGTLEPDSGSTFEMLDRVVVVKMGYSVPFGLRGTIMGIHPGEGASDTLFDVFFDQEFVGGIVLRGCTEKRGYRVPAIAVLNLTYGEMRKQGHPRQQQGQAPPPQNAWRQPPVTAYGYQGNRMGGQDQGQGTYSMLLRQQGPRQAAGGYGMISSRQDQRSGYNNYGTQPQFVTPKFATSPPKTTRGPASNKPSAPGPDTSDFNSFWTQLQQSNTAASNSKPPWSGNTKPLLSGKDSGSNSYDSPIFGNTSLQSAAEKLGKIPLPSADLMDMGQPDNPPTGILVDLSESASARHDGSGKGSEVGKVKEVESCNLSQSKGEGETNSSQQANPSVLALFEKASKAREKSKSPAGGVLTVASQPVSADKVQALFEQAQKQAAASEPASNEFNALFAALQAVPKSVSPSSQVAASQNSVEDGSAALKQMLKIGVEEMAASEQSSKKSYGRQVSVQELFDVVKQAPSAPQPETSAAESHPPPPPQPPTSTQQGMPTHPEQLKQQQQQQQPQQQLQPPFPQAIRPAQSVQQSLLPPPPLLGTPGVQGWNKSRKPVDELATICQASGQPLPKYDFNYQPKQKSFISLVTLPGGARFEGSMAPSQQEAADSAASMAMLCLKQAQIGFPGQRGAPWMQRPAPGMGMLRPGQRLFSPNSAFSPVANPLLCLGPGLFNQPHPGLLPPPGQRGRQPLLSQPPPPFPNRGPPPHPVIQPPNGARAPFTPSSTSQNQLNHPQPANQSMSPSEPRHPAANLDTHNMEAASQSTEVKVKESSPQTKSATEAFIPLQVTRKQRRKEETPEKQSSSRSVNSVEDGVSVTYDTSPREDRKSFSKSPSTEMPRSVNSTSQANSCAGTDTPSSHTSSKVATEQKPSSSPRVSESGAATGRQPPREQGSVGSGKKRRPRIAANFSGGASK